MEWLILLALIFVPVIILVLLYNRLVALRQARRNAFSDIDVQLRQRYDLVPRLVEVVKGYAAHEKEVFQSVTEARARVGQARGTGEERQAAEGRLGGALMSLFAVAENYPQLKADQNFLQLQNELADIENKIAAARRFFNNATNEYNTTIHQFPSNIVANMFGYHEEPYFELDDKLEEAVREAPEVDFS